MMTMLLMTVDGRIGVLYNEILGQLDEEKRKKATDELKSLKEISTQLNDAISKMLAFDSKTPGKFNAIFFIAPDIKPCEKNPPRDHL